MNTPTTHRPFRSVTLSLFESAVQPKSLTDSIAESLAALQQIGPQFGAWALPFSGGKDSGATWAFVMWAIEMGYVAAPKRLIVLRSDTTLELEILGVNAERIMTETRRRGFEAYTVTPLQADRFFVSIFGRGLVPPHPSYKGRWCTRVLKVKPMKVVLDRIAQEIDGKFLLMSGVRLGESKQRDAKLMNSKTLAYEACSKDSGECGAGGIWMDARMSNIYTALPLIVHWRECSVYDFLQGWFRYPKLPNDAPSITLDHSLPPMERAIKWKAQHAERDQVYGRVGHSLENFTRPIAQMYGQHLDGLVEQSVRFGCMECPLITEDRMMQQAVKVEPRLAPVHELRNLWAELRKPQYRLWKPSKNRKGMVGPLSIPARQKFLPVVLGIQERAGVALVTSQDKLDIEAHWEAGTHPRGWTGNEPIAADVLDGPRFSFATTGQEQP